MKGFEDGEGDTATDAPPRTVRVMPSPRMDKCLSVELHACTLDWICKAIYATWNTAIATPTKRKWHDKFKLPPLPTGAKCRKRAVSLAVAAPYFDGSNWKCIQKSISKVVSPDRWKEHALDVADRVLALAAESHKVPVAGVAAPACGDAWGSDDGGDAGKVDA